MELATLDNLNNKPIPADDHQPMSKRRILKNLLVLCLGFFLLFSSYQALANLQSTLNIEGDVGVVSQSVVYASLIASALLLPKLVIRRLGCKSTLALSSLAYAPFMAANFDPRLAVLVPASVLIGAGAAPLWSAKCTYLNQLSALYADNTHLDVVTSRFFGVFFMFFQNTQVFGNLVSFVVLRPPSGVDVNVTITPPDNITCGAGFCTAGDAGNNANLKPPTQEKRVELIAIYVALSLVSTLVFALFLDPLPPKKEEGGSVLSTVAATLKHLRNVDQLLLVPVTIFSGVEQAFMLGDFTKAYVGCAWGMHNVGLVFICYGMVNAAMSLVAGRLVKHVPRAALMGGAALSNAGVCAALILWRPDGAQPTVFFVLMAFWGASDAVYQTQINALHGILFRSEEEAAFANYRLWESFGFSVAFGCSMLLCMTPKIIVVLAFLLVGMAGYFTVEVRNRKKMSLEISS